MKVDDSRAPELYEFNVLGADIVVYVNQNDPSGTVVSISRSSEADVNIQVQADDEIVAEL